MYKKISSIEISISQSGFPSLWCFYRWKNPRSKSSFVLYSSSKSKRSASSEVGIRWWNFGIWERMGCLWFYLAGGFKYFFQFSSLFGEMIQFDEHIFQMGWFKHQRMLWLFFLNLVFFGKSEVLVTHLYRTRSRSSLSAGSEKSPGANGANDKRDGSWCYVFRRDSPLTFEIGLCECMARAWECSNKI